MSVCQKCWHDAGIAAATRGVSKAEEYSRLIDERASNKCTPEQQAGPEATECPKCHLVAVHEITGVCMGYECDYDSKEVE